MYLFKPILLPYYSVTFTANNHALIMPQVELYNPDSVTLTIFCKRHSCGVTIHNQGTTPGMGTTETT